MTLDSTRKIFVNILLRYNLEMSICRSCLFGLSQKCVFAKTCIIYTFLLNKVIESGKKSRYIYF